MVDDDFTWENKDKFLAVVVRQVTKLLNAVSADFDDDRYHPIPAQLRAKVKIIPVGRSQTDGLINIAEASRSVMGALLERLGQWRCVPTASKLGTAKTR